MPRHQVWDTNGNLIIDEEMALDTSQEALDLARAIELLATSPPAITMPEMWELMRIYARLLNIQ